LQPIFVQQSATLIKSGLISITCIDLALGTSREFYYHSGLVQVTCALYSPMHSLSCLIAFQPVRYLLPMYSDLIKSVDGGCKWIFAGRQPVATASVPGLL